MLVKPPYEYFLGPLKNKAAWKVLGGRDTGRGAAKLHGVFPDHPTVSSPVRLSLDRDGA